MALCWFSKLKSLVYILTKSLILNSEEAKELFKKRIEEFAQGSIEQMTYEEFGKARKEKYEKGEKSRDRDRD